MIKKLINRKSQKDISPYANINWDKASVIFQKATKSDQSASKYPKVRDMLKIVAAAGAIGLIFAFPGAAVGIGSLILGENSFSPWRTRKIFEQLKRQKYISTEYNKDGSVTVTVTRKGRVKALTYQLDSMRLNKPKHWDHKWRVVIFDIPNKYKRVRDIFRIRIKQLGLYQLQESVYVSPFACFDEVEFLRELYGVAIKVRYLLVDKIEDDDSLKIHFELG